jgi:hypothetical protein
MKKKTFGINLGIIVGLSLIMVLTAIDASAWGGYRGGRYHYNHGFYSGYYHHGNYGWGYPWPYWYDYNVVSPSIGGFVAYLPDGYTTVIVGGTPYYFCGGYYFRPYSTGYVIVPAPVAAVATPAPQTQGTGSGTQQQSSSITTEQTSPSSVQLQSLNTAGEEPKTASGAIAQPKPALKDTATINIPNSKGGFTPVKLVKHNNGYLGPQGEFYAGHPTVDQLRALYGN